MCTCAEIQRLGLKKDKIIMPAIKGIKEGRDGLLEEAIRMIEKK